MKPLKQLFCNQPLSAGAEIALDKELCRRISKVLRLSVGAKLRLFNGRDGVFVAELLPPEGRTVRLVELFAPQPAPAGAVLMIALTKKEAMNHVFRQATEMGVRAIQPLTTDFTVPDKLNTERVEALLVEAAEQCERMDIPELLPVKPLKEAVSAFGAPVFWCAEHIRGGWITAEDAAAPAVLVGPEGGFSDTERAFLAAQDHVVPVGLGDYILRVDTAVVAALACAQISRK